MPSDFPFFVGRIALTEDWSLQLPFACKQRMEEGSMVLWRPGFTIWLTVWGNEDGLSVTAQKERSASAVPPERYDERESQEGGRLYYSYRLAEQSEDSQVPAFYGFAFADHGFLQMACHFDSEQGLPFAERILKSASSEPATLSDPRVYSQICFASNMILQDGHPVGYCYRDEPASDDDSGWRFFSGQESQEYINDADNLAIVPVAFVVQASPHVSPLLLAETGSRFELKGEEYTPA